MVDACCIPKCTSFKRPKLTAHALMSLCGEAFKLDHEMLVCKRTYKHTAHIYLITSQILRFDKRTKPYCDFGFILINRANTISDPDLAYDY